MQQNFTHAGALRKPFPKRTPCSLPEVICEWEYEAMKTSEDNPYLYLCFRIARKGMPPERYSADEARAMLEEIGVHVSEDFHDMPMKMRCAAAFAEYTMTDDMLRRIADSVESAYKEGGEKGTAIDIVFPVSIADGINFNPISLAQAHLLQQRIREFLPKDMREIPVRINVNDVEGEYKIFNVTKNRRGKSYDRDDPMQNLINGIGKLAKQPAFTGTVNPDTLYVLCDDAVCLQTTLRALGGYIDRWGGTVAAMTTLIKRQGAEFIDIRRETVECLRTVLSMDAAAPARGDGDAEEGRVNGASVGWVEAMNHRQLNSLLSVIGLHVDFESPERSTASNYETMLLCAYFMDWDNPTHRESFLKALDDVSANPEILEKEGIGSLCYQQMGTVDGLRALFASSLSDAKSVLQIRR